MPIDGEGRRLCRYAAGTQRRKYGTTEQQPRPYRDPVFLLSVCLDPRGVRAAAHRTVMSAPTFPCDNEE